MAENKLRVIYFDFCQFELAKRRAWTLSEIRTLSSCSQIEALYWKFQSGTITEPLSANPQILD